ncbi:MAG: DUF1287 domain-containing protein [Erysipelotrichales bacterium]|nr:MAG: DUF1287 domain-containing protein [Erysipelotrichales bacterium]
MKNNLKRRKIRVGRLLMLVVPALFIIISSGYALGGLLKSDEKPNIITPVDGLPLVLLRYGIAPLPDYDQDGVDDFRDIVYGARIDAQNHVTYRDIYYAGGYPPENEGVCTDLIWRALLNAGYNLKDLMDEDIVANRSKYAHIKYRDPNIDFRRVYNMKIFLDLHAMKLTNDIYLRDQWMPGDIVIFGDDYHHIGIVSDIMNPNGIPYLIHNNGQPRREEDRLEFGYSDQGVTGHYRWILH